MAGCGAPTLCLRRSLLFKADRAPAGASRGELVGRVLVAEGLPEGDRVPGLDVETLGLKVTVLLTPGDLFELAGAGGMRGVVSVPDGMMGGLCEIGSFFVESDHLIKAYTRDSDLKLKPSVPSFNGERLGKPVPERHQDGDYFERKTARYSTSRQRYGMIEWLYNKSPIRWNTMC